MASWDSYPPPPRRDRSSSPGQKYPQRAPFPDGRYQSDYRGADWDAYDRDRYGAYGRDSPTDSRRPRSRSPGPGDGSKKRRRSPSPWERDRYEPRPRYSDDYDRGYGGGGYSPRRANHGARGRPPPDPRSFDYPASLKQYADWFRYTYPQRATEEDNEDKLAEQRAGDGSKPRNGIKTLWEKYKKDFAATQLQTMFDHHRKSPWFAEKYDPAPELQKLRLRVRKEGWKGRLVTFLHDLDSGKFDPDLNEPEPESKGPKDTPAIPDAKESNAPEEPKNPGDDDMQFAVDAEDDPMDSERARGDANGKDARRGYDRDRGEEVIAPTEGNQVMIRTIPPDIGRVKLEEACCKLPGYVYLALGDPMQKRNYYRAGWLRFDENADMGAIMSELSDTKIEGFKLHVSHNTRPFSNRVRYAPEVASKPDRLEKDLVNAIALANLLEEQAAQLRQMKLSKEEPPKPQGDAPPTGESMDAAAPPSDVPVEEDEEEPMEKGTEAVERRVEKIMSDLREQGLLDMNDEAVVAARKTIVSLDMYLEYLRAAFHTCYYCAVTTDHVEELQRKCLKHVRKPLTKTLIEEIKAAEIEKAERENRMDEGDEDKKDSPRKDFGKDRDWKRNDERWLDWLDAKVALLINRDGVDPREYNGKHYDDELSKVVEPFIKQEDEGKFRCKTCQKLFKATSFVEKHIANKHSELTKALDDLPYYNNFALDPHRIQPLTHPPPQTGNVNQAPPPQAYGVQLQAIPSHQGDYGGRQGGHYPPQQGYGGGGGPGNGHWDHGGYTGGGGGGGYAGGSGRRERRLSDRIGGDFTFDIPAGAGLPPKPMPSALDSALSSGNSNNNNNNQRRGGRGGAGNGFPPPPPPDAKEDPRAAAGRRVSYHDMDLVAEGDVELSY